MMTPLERARKYLIKCDPAISGQGGHNQTFTVACALVNGFALPEADALMLLSEYNRHCSPAWKESELRHKIQSAISTQHDKPRGHLLGSIRYVHRATTSPIRTEVIATPKIPAKTYDLKRASALPEPLTDSTRAFLRAAFQPGEGISIAQEVLNEEGKGVPKSHGITLSLEEWLKKLDSRDGDPNKIFSSSDKTGAFIRINPMKLGGSKDSDVIAYRHALIEFDKISIEEQWNLILQSEIPCTAVLHSGNRSLHAWVKVDASDRAQYDERVRILYSHFADYGIDDKNKNPSRLSRLPGMIRGSKKQLLIALNTGAESFSAWQQNKGEIVSLEENDLPEIISGKQLIQSKMPTPQVLISGMLHQGEKMVIGGGSKSFKTWALLDLALCVSKGIPWLGNQTTQGKVLYVNFEIHDCFFQSRVVAVADSRNLDPEDWPFEYWGLRGYSASIDILIPKMLKKILTEKYALIIIDPIYKGLGDRNENDSGDMNNLLNHIEQLAQKSGAAVGFGAHFSKGNQAAKNSIDRISGSGVFARDPDAILTLTPHESDGCFVVESVLRNFAPKDPFVVKWQYPVFSVDADLDVKKLKGFGRPDDYSDSDLVEILNDLEKDGVSHLSHKWVDAKTWLKIASESCGISRQTMYRKISKLLKEKKIAKDVKFGYRVLMRLSK